MQVLSETAPWAAEYLPVPQSTQSANWSLPVLDEYFPAGQFVHTPSPAESLNLPGCSRSISFVVYIKRRNEYGNQRGRDLNAEGERECGGSESGLSLALGHDVRLWLGTYSFPSNSSK